MAEGGPKSRGREPDAVLPSPTNSWAALIGVPPTNAFMNAPHRGVISRNLPGDVLRWFSWVRHGSVMTTHASPRDSAPAFFLEGLTKRFGDRKVVDGLSFELPQGGVTGFLGPNGSGKSTTIRMLLGLIRPSSGTARVLGHPLSTPAAFTGRVGALVDSPALYPALSGHENLAVHAELAGLHRGRVGAVLEVVDLHDFARAKVRSYSLGMKQRLAIAIALLRDPPLLVLDEPTNGLDPVGIVEIRNLLVQLGGSGRTVFVSSHVLAEMQAACDRYVVIRNGSLVFAGSSDQLLARGPQQVTVRPEWPTDLRKLEDVLNTAGFRTQANPTEVIIDADPDRSPEINRICFEAAVTLRELRCGHQDLEDVFFNVMNASSKATSDSGVAS